MEYNIYDRELTKSKEQLAEMESAREGERDKHQEIYIHLQQIQDRIQADEDNLATIKESMDRLHTSKQSKREELDGIDKQRSTLEAELQEIASFQSENQNENKWMWLIKKFTEHFQMRKGTIEVEPEYAPKINNL